MDQLEQVFIQGINEKSEKAFRELFGRFHNYLVMFALRRVRLLEAAEDIVQDVFVFIWESDKVYNSYLGFKAYLYELVQNRCLNYLKHKAVEERYMTYVQNFTREGRGMILCRKRFTGNCICWQKVFPINAVGCLS